MALEELLIGFSQLGAGFIGFIAIVLAFARDDGTLSPVDALRVRSILHTSFLIIMGGIVPLILLAYEFNEPMVWRISAAVGAVVGVMTSIEGALYQSKMNKRTLKQAGYLHGMITWGASFIGLLLMGFTAFGKGDLFGQYVLALGVAVFISAVNFIMIALQKWLSGDT